MNELPESLRAVDWRLTTWSGTRREQLRRWAALPLARLIASLEEMAQDSNRLSAAFGTSRVRETAPSYAPAEARRSVDRRVLDEIVRRIVEVAQPDRIILFGSAARDEMGPDSDIDLLVIKSGVEHRRQLAGDIYMNLSGVNAPVDVVVATPEDVAKYRDSAGTIIRTAFRDGREIYVA